MCPSVTWQTLKYTAYTTKLYSCLSSILQWKAIKQSWLCFSLAGRDTLLSPRQSLFQAVSQTFVLLHLASLHDSPLHDSSETKALPHFAVSLSLCYYHSLSLTFCVRPLHRSLRLVEKGLRCNEMLMSCNGVAIEICATVREREQCLFDKVLDTRFEEAVERRTQRLRCIQLETTCYKPMGKHKPLTHSLTHPPTHYTVRTCCM